METTKKHSPFTHFNADYYNNLRLMDVSKAEEYRRQMTAPVKGSRNLSHEKYADQKLQSEIEKNINFVKEYAQKNKISEEQAIIDIRQSYIDSVNKTKVYKPTEEEAKKILLQNEQLYATVDPDKLEGVLPDNTIGNENIPHETPIQPNEENSDGAKEDTNTDQNQATTDENTNVNPYADVTKNTLLGLIKEIDPQSPVNDRTNKETLVKTYEELLAIKNEETK